MNTIITLSILAVVTMFLGVYNQRKILLPVVIAGLLVALGFVVNDWNTSQHWFNEMIVIDNFSSMFGGLMIVATLVVFLIPSNYFEENTKHLEAVYAIILFSLTGGLIMISASNLVTFFVGLEILSISLYLLAGSHKSSVASTEAAMKYFIMGSFASAFLLFGIALLFGGTGSMNFAEISNFINSNAATLPLMLKAGIILFALGMAFKIAAAPFHFWAPDVYHGSPTIITTFMITTVKVAGLAAILRLTQTCFGSDTSIWTLSISIISVLSIVIGNFTALAQTKVKRMLAYSSIAHTGYFLIALVSLQEQTTSIVFYYTIAYVLSNLVAFIVLVKLKETRGSSDCEVFNGLAKSNPIAAFSMAIAMLSLTGIPPLVGFMAKYFVFTSAIQAGYLWLVLIAIVGSLTSIFYYFRPIISMYMKPSDDNFPVTFSKTSIVLLILLTGISLIVGFLPSLFLM